MRPGISYLTLAVVVVLSLPASSQSSEPQESHGNGGDFSNATTPITKVPKDTIIVKGAWSSASDSVTPVPEGNAFTNDVFRDPYFGMSYTLPSGWAKNYDGPPPSDSGRYVLAQIKVGDKSKDSSRGTILITADDLFFTPLPANNTLQLVSHMKDNLQPDYKQEEPPTPTKIAGRPFTFFAYWSPVAGLHWYVAATQIPLPCGGNGADQPRYEAAGKLASGSGQDDPARGGRSHGRHWWRRLPGVHEGLRAQRERPCPDRARLHRA